MKYYIIAGEKSGDLHAAHLISELKKHDHNAIFRGWGGEEMQKAGCDLQKHYRETAFMGFWEVLKNMNVIKRFLKECKNDILNFAPDVVILVDYPGFNLRMARFAKEKGFKTFYYISPKLWAWNQSRIKAIKKYVDRMFSILPFEVDFYKKFGYEIDYVGNPLFDNVSNFRLNPSFYTDHNIVEDRPIVALLPGSRADEVKRLLPLMVETAHHFPDYQFVVAGVSSLPDSLYAPARKAELWVVYDQTYDLLARSKAAIVASGTASLETALFEVPQVVVYEVSGITAMIARLVIKVRFVSLVNLIADKEIVKELLQENFNLPNLIQEMNKLLGAHRRNVMLGYQEVKGKIATEGASQRAASLMWKYLNE